MEGKRRMGYVRDDDILLPFGSYEGEAVGLYGGVIFYRDNIYQHHQEVLHLVVDSDHVASDLKRLLNGDRIKERDMTCKEPLYAIRDIVENLDLAIEVTSVAREEHTVAEVTSVVCNSSYIHR